MAKAGDHAREAPLQRALGHPHGSYERLQLALHRLLGRRVRSPGKPLLRRTGLHYPPSTELGTYVYIYTGGEPLVRKKDLIALCEKHSDAAFLSFTNATLIDEEFCQDMLRVGNFIPAISLEGFEEANDSRRGEGVYDKVTHAMALLKQHHLPFGISACYTSVNYKDITSEKFLRSDHGSGRLLRVGSSTTCPVGQRRRPPS